MRTPAALSTLLCLLTLAPHATDGPLERAALAWDAGDYVSALTTYLQILDGKPDDAAIEHIALQTGELFTTRELTTDGDDPQFSADGQQLTYETSGPLHDRRLRLMTGDGSRLIKEVRGFRATFSRTDNRLTYLRVAEPSQALRDAY